MNRINHIIANMNKISCIINNNESDLDKELKHLSTIGLSEKLMCYLLFELTFIIKNY